MKTRYEILTADARFILSSVTLFGDRDDDTDQLLLLMIREGLAVSHTLHGPAAGIVVRRSQVSL